VEGFAEEDFVICVLIGVTHVEKFTGRSNQTLTLKLESVLAWIASIYIGNHKVVALEGCSRFESVPGER
jgi:hypothetical protein